MQASPSAVGLAAIAIGGRPGMRRPGAAYAELMHFFGGATAARHIGRWAFGSGCMQIESFDAGERLIAAGANARHGIKARDMKKASTSNEP